MNRYFKDATPTKADEALKRSAAAFEHYKSVAAKDRAAFLYAIANELEIISSALIVTAANETHLEKARLEIELRRTLFQLTSYADACTDGAWMEIRIDTGDARRDPPEPDLRKMLIPLGPVVVFGASNFPFAYSTAGGDTACALAAGCTVLVKAHPAHPETSELVATATHKAARTCELSEDIFIHLHGASFDVGKALVQHPLTKAVGFTGSFEGGKALFDVAMQREVPIPVFAEMGSVNPVFILPQKLKAGTDLIVPMLTKSITQSAGQFCTNPGILVAIDGADLHNFKRRLGDEVAKVPGAEMLHPGIAKAFHQKRKLAAMADGVTLLTPVDKDVREHVCLPTLAEVCAEKFLQNPSLHKEIFGPYSLLVSCTNADDMHRVAAALEGQLTCTVLATEDEVLVNKKLTDTLKEKCGRIVFNGVPTGVEVALAMHHGGPYPATTDSRFTAVGADGIKRFARPLCYQGWSNGLLPDELKNENPLGIWRTVNNKLTNNPIRFE